MLKKIHLLNTLPIIDFFHFRGHVDYSFKSVQEMIVVRL